MFWFRNETINYALISKAPDTCHCKLISTYRFVQNKFLISFYHKVFLSILTAPPVTNHAVLYDVCNVKLQLYAKGLIWSRGGGGGGTSVKLFLFSIC